MEERLSLKRMLTMSWVYLAVLVLGSWVVSSWAFAWAVLAGGIISIISFWVSFWDLMGFMDQLSGSLKQETPAELERLKKTKKGLILKFWLRILLIGLVLFFLIKMTSVNVFGLILGLTTVVFTVTFTACGEVWKYYFSRR